MEKRREESGQAFIEFLLTISFILGFLFMFIRLSLYSTSGFMAHYATFMASRTYLVVDDASLSDENVYSLAKSRAEDVFSHFKIERFGIKNGVLSFNSPSFTNNRAYKLYVGAFYTFKQALSGLSLLTGGKTLDLVTESFLGKAPSRSQCQRRICEIMRLKTGIAGACESVIQSHTTLYDNGC